MIKLQLTLAFSLSLCGQPALRNGGFELGAPGDSPPGWRLRARAFSMQPLIGLPVFPGVSVRWCDLAETSA